MNYTPYSFSKISTYKSCPRKFNYVYILKLGNVIVDTPALKKGRCVHSILEYYPNVPDDIKELDEFQLAKEVCDKFLNSPLGHYVKNDFPKAAETKIGLNKELQPCDYKDENVLFKGIVDHIVVNDILYICDFKTGKLVEPQWQSYDQLMFYAIYFFMKYPNISKIQISYLYVEHNNENKLMLERKYLMNYIKELIDIIKTIENDKTFNPNISKLCNYCDFSELCKAENG